jgi:hypothetical protein
LNNFKEWFSDNLRYFILGFFIIVVLVLAFIGIRFASARFGNQAPNEAVAQTTPVITKELQQEASSEETVATAIPTKPAQAENSLEKNVYPQVNAIIQNYYKALSVKDIEGIKAVVDELDATEEAKIINDQYIDGYSNIEVYTKAGLEEGDYIVLASYNYKFKDIDTLVPGLSQLYVRTREDGSLYIFMMEQDEQTQQYITEALQSEAVEVLIQEVSANYTLTQENNEELRAFINNLGIAS